MLSTCEVPFLIGQAGVPVKLLAVQYRMHPEIRAFPSAYFYDSQLKDAQSVCLCMSKSCMHECEVT
jgi:superfamily I DNA and/or RNA helicase